MEQIIKKINMIDILGMLLPGGLMLLFLEMDFGMLLKLKQYFEFEGGNLLWISIFLCASYFLGMLLHELGSVIEKLMWRNPVLNPRVYAAVSTGLLFNYGEKVEAVKKAGELLTVDEYIHKHGEQKDSDNGKKTAGKQDLEAKDGYKLWIVWRAVLSLIGFATAYFAVGELDPCKYVGVAVVAVILCVVLHWNSFRTFWKAAWNKTCRDNMRRIIGDERVIQKEAVTSEENSRKYGLFCGYYALMRSVLVLMAIMQIYFIIQTGKGPSDLLEFYNTVKDYPLNYLRYVIVAALTLRYWHYACAKFTYTYNGYINNKLFPKDEDKTTKMHVTIENVDPTQGVKPGAPPEATV